MRAPDFPVFVFVGEHHVALQLFGGRQIIIGRVFGQSSRMQSLWEQIFSLKSLLGIRFDRNVEFGHVSVETS